MVRHVCSLFHNIQRIISLHFMLLNVDILKLLACCWCWCKLVHLVPMLTVDRLCHSLLRIGLFIDTFTFFPLPLFGLAALFGCFAWDLLVRTYTLTVTSNYHIHGWISTGPAAEPSGRFPPPLLAGGGMGTPPCALASRRWGPIDIAVHTYTWSSGDTSLKFYGC